MFWNNPGGAWVDAALDDLGLDAADCEQIDEDELVAGGNVPQGSTRSPTVSSAGHGSYGRPTSASSSPAANGPPPG
jgi:hypothetical protein